MAARKSEDFKKNIDHILLILPFEKEFLKKFNIQCDFVGHPISSSLQPKTRDVISFKKFKYQRYNKNCNSSPRV